MLNEAQHRTDYDDVTDHGDALEVAVDEICAEYPAIARAQALLGNLKNVLAQLPEDYAADAVLGLDSFAHDYMPDVFFMAQKAVYAERDAACHPIGDAARITYLQDALVGLMSATSSEAFAGIKDRETDLAFHTNLGRAWGEARSALNWLPAGDAS